MNSIAEQLSKLIKINRKIMNQLHKDEAGIVMLRKWFNKRSTHVEKLSAATENYESSSLSNRDKKRLRSLFERFEEQQHNIQQALEYILAESKERLDDAIKRNKAEQSYRVLNR